MPAEVIQLRLDSAELASPAVAVPLVEPQGIHLVVSLDSKAVELLRASPVIASQAAKRPYTRRIEQVFWDTPDHRLGRSGTALALQTSGQRRIQVVTPIRNAQTGGRPVATIETAIQGTRPDLVRLALTPGTDPVLVSSLDPHGMIPIFAVEVRRTYWSLSWGDTRLALTLDIGSITTSQGDSAVSQAGLTHLGGPTGGLYDFARVLNRSVPFALATLVPAQQGYRLVVADDWWPTLAKPHLTRTMSVRDGVLAIGQAATTALRIEIEALVHSQQPARIHQARVAIRRLRSVLSVFAPVLPTLTRRALGQELNTLASRLGDAREWDVFLAETLAPMEEWLPEERTLSSLRLTGAVLREQAAGAALAAVCEERSIDRGVSAAFMDLSLRLAAWFDAGIWPEPPSADAQFWLDQPLVALAQELLGKRHRKLVKSAHGLKDPRPEELHDLRIEAKKLRYTSEFFARLFHGKPAKHYVASLAQIQDILGTINDAATSHGLVLRLCGSGQTPDMHAIGLFNGWTAAQAATARAQFERSWRTFLDVKRYWKDK